MKKGYLYITVFFSGMTALAVEMLASRLIGNVYGSSNLVWACVIGLILIYLTAGYWLGGKLADKHPNYSAFYQIILWGSVTIGIVPMISRPLLRITANAFDQLQIGLLAGSFVTILILFIVPMTLIGMVSPFALKLTITDTQSTGKTAGRLSAISTLGSFIGTFIPVLILIPLIGTYRSFLLFSSMLMLIASIGYWLTEGFRSWLKYIWMPVVLLLLWIFGVRGLDKATLNVIYEDESSYNYIQVIEDEQFRFLRLNEGQGIHSVYHPTVFYYNGPWSQVLVAPYFNPAPFEMENVNKIAIVGLAAGTTARQISEVYGRIPIDGFEIDPKIVEVGYQYFDMDQPNLSVLIGDGRWSLAHSEELYDIISVDAYRPPYIPWHMTTVEFFQTVHDHLTSNGALVINVGRSPLDRTLVNDLSTTIGQVFPTVFIMDVPGSFNSIVFATKHPGSWENFINNYGYLQEQGAHPLLLQAMTSTIYNRQPEYQITQVYTDDRTPVEWLTNKIVLDFLLSGEVNNLQ